MRNTTLATLALLIGTGLFAACTTETGTPSAGGADGGADASAACTVDGSGTGTVDVTIAGLPADITVDPATPIVHFAATGATPAGASQSTQLTAPAGQYTVRADVQRGTDPIVRTAYAATVTPSSFCLGNGQTQSVTVTYAPIASSNKLWTTSNAAAGQVIGFASSSLAATGTPAATVAMKAPAGRSIAFDAEGNMWTLRDTVAGPPIQRYAASTLGASGEKTPDRTIDLEPSCLPGYTALAFSPSGELYVSSACEKKISRFAVADLGASTDAGAPAPNLTLGGLDAPEGIAFDKDGNLWVADSGSKTIARFDAARLSTPSSDPPNLVITSETPSKGDLGPNHLAFDGAGNLWASSFGGNILFRLTPADMSGTGPKTLTPATQITLPVDALIEGIAFDEAGALWVTLSTGKIGRLSPAQLGISTSAGAPAIPEVIVTSADLGNAASLAFFPPPSQSPIFGH